MILAQRKGEIHKSTSDRRSTVRIESVGKYTIGNDFRTREVNIHKSALDHRSTDISEHVKK